MFGLVKELPQVSGKELMRREMVKADMHYARAAELERDIHGIEAELDAAALSNGYAAQPIQAELRQLEQQHVDSVASGGSGVENFEARRAGLRSQIEQANIALQKRCEELRRVQTAKAQELNELLGPGCPLSRDCWAQKIIEASSVEDRDQLWALNELRMQLHTLGQSISGKLSAFRGELEQARRRKEATNIVNGENRVRRWECLSNVLTDVISVVSADGEALRKRLLEE
jgi:hypothetical protein